MKLYTKTGDKGQTSLIGGTRVDKNDIRIEAYGTVDELNSFVGLLSTSSLSERNLDFLRKIQHLLFDIGALLATDTSKSPLRTTTTNISEHDISVLEQEIDYLENLVPPLTAFVLPGGVSSGALCHVCRTITRRAERRILEMNKTHAVDNLILIYFNRLSDYFFALSRFLTTELGGKEIYWKR